MPGQPFISLCIPCYRRADLLERLLSNIREQTFTDYEIVITDNSEDDAVEQLARSFQISQPLSYHRNIPSVSMGENWNQCMQRANGKWLKMMHDDDWFSGPNSLAVFAERAVNAGDNGFIFSAFEYVDEQGSTELHHTGSYDLKKLEKSPYHVLRNNAIGQPSTTLIRRDVFRSFKALKWVVDIEGYIRMLQAGNGKFIYIPQKLISLQRHEGQATKEYFRNPEVEIPENLELLNSHYPDILNNWFAYDYFWRLLRNLGIRDKSMLEKYSAGQKIPGELIRMLRYQKKVPLKWLRVGSVSKTLMTISYMSCRL